VVEWTGIDRERIEHWEAGFSVDFTLQELYLLLWTVSRKFEPVLKPVERTVDCHRCRVPLEPRKTSRMVMGIAVDNLPGTICPHCGEEWRPDVELIAILEEPIDIARIPEGSKLEFVCWKKGMGRGHGIRSTGWTGFWIGLLNGALTWNWPTWSCILICLDSADTPDGTPRTRNSGVWSRRIGKKREKRPGRGYLPGFLSAERVYAG